MSKMISDILSNINWVDVVIVLFVFRIIYVGTKNGFVVELFKFIGLVFSVFISFHYYSDFSRFLYNLIAIPKAQVNVLCLGFLVCIVLFLFKLIREGMMIMLKVQAHQILDRWGGLTISILRGVLVGSLVLVAMKVSRIDYLQKNVDNSFLSFYLQDISTSFYKVCYNGFIEKLFPNEKLNPALFKLSSDKNL